MQSLAFTSALNVAAPCMHNTTSLTKKTTNRCKTTSKTITMISTPSPTRTAPSPTPVRDVSTQKDTKKPGMYRLYIYNDPFNKRERVVGILVKTCDGLSFSRAYSAMQEAHENGRGLVLIIAQEIAEHYCACINSAGVLSSVEPDN